MLGRLKRKEPIMSKLIFIAVAVLVLSACKKDGPKPPVPLRPARDIIKQPDVVRDTIIIINHL
jgi:hypothetical protein